ncbi:uncharacterized protein [Nicotiana sylvestris]|uniref:Uncharacterized protein isoform X2 n=1 Tax=Nicotiana tabacum TaxID=4097 RepID=A0A1S3ZIP9_TOBAC|nr:PREDICTED: uncharacterized protein LOC107787133 isoform X2 [Nicotiana tabacum]
MASLPSDESYHFRAHPSSCASKPWACSLLLFYVHLVSNGAWYPYGAIKNIDGEGILTDISCSWMASDNGRAFFKHWQFEYINLKEEETEKKKY